MTTTYLEITYGPNSEGIDQVTRDELSEIINQHYQFDSVEAQALFNFKVALQDSSAALKAQLDAVVNTAELRLDRENWKGNIPDSRLYTEGDDGIVLSNDVDFRAWPRENVPIPHSNNKLFPPDVIPRQIKLATALLASYIITYPNYLQGFGEAQSTGQTKKVKVGEIELEYNTDTSQDFQPVDVNFELPLIVKALIKDLVHSNTNLQLQRS